MQPFPSTTDLWCVYGYDLIIQKTEAWKIEELAQGLTTGEN